MDGYSQTPHAVDASHRVQSCRCLGRYCELVDDSTLSLSLGPWDVVAVIVGNLLSPLRSEMFGDCRMHEAVTLISIWDLSLWIWLTCHCVISLVIQKI